MADPHTEKKARPSKLRNRLAFAFGLFAFTIVTALGVVETWIWETMHEAHPSPILPVLLSAGAMVIAIAALGGYLIAGPLARPMEMWAEAADRIGLGERDVSFPQGGGSHELARVSAAMQSMFSRLSEKEDLLQERIRERTTALIEATEALATERERLANALEGSRLAFWDLDLDSGEIRLSSEWARMLGDPEGETVTTVQDLLTRVPEEEHAVISQNVFSSLKEPDGRYDTDHRVRRADGNWLWVRSRGRVTARAADGRALRMVGTNVDIASRKDQEDRQRESEERLRQVLDGVGSSICHVDLSGRILFANRRYHEFYSLADGTAKGMVVRDIAGDEGAAAFERCLPRLLAGNEVQYDREARVRGRKVHIEMRLVPHRDANGITESVYAVLTDISERKAAERLLERQALTDPITGLPNRRLFIEHLERSLAQGDHGSGGIAVLYVDLDGFKAINETFGHDGGDALLRQAGARYVAAVRGVDTVARIDRDEYAVLVVGCRSMDDAEVVARKLVEALRPPFTLPKGNAELTCSVGIALAPGDGADPEALLRSADKAMTRAKKAGKNSFARHS